VSAFLNAANAPFRPHPSRSSWPDHCAGPRSHWRSPHRGSGRVQHLFQRGQYGLCAKGGSDTKVLTV